MGQTLVNHSYVDLNTVGSDNDNSDSVVCHSDLTIVNPRRACAEKLWREKANMQMS